MKRRAGLVLTLLAIGALACQAVTGLFQEGGDGPSVSATTVGQPEISEPTLVPPTGAAPEEEVGRIDPCSLLTDEQISAVHGEPPGEPIQDTHDYVGLGAVPSCFWTGVYLEVSVLVPPPGEAPEDYYQEYIRRMNPDDFPGGLGDEAWGDTQGGEVLVRQSDIYFMVEEQTFEADNYEQNKALAAMVLENLP